MHYQLKHGDALLFLEQMPDASVDCIVTDIPYWTLDQHRNIGTTTRLGGHRDAEKRTGWFETIDQTETYECLCQFARILPKSGHAWVMCDGKTLGYVLGFVNEGETGFKYVKPYPVLKRARGGGYRQGLGYHLRGAHEYAVLCEKGRRRFPTELESRPDIFAPIWSGDAETKPFTPDGKPYSTAKPFELMSDLIQLSSARGETVIDPFCGSGTTGVAALALGRKFIGFDRSEYAIATTTKRLGEGAGRLFPLSDLPG